MIRYDQLPPRAPGYTGADLASDAIAILDALGVGRVHVIGLSMGGAIAQRVALGQRDGSRA